MRYAIYFTPPREHPLTQAAAAWLGRDPFAGAEIATPSVEDLSSKDIAPLVAEPRRYGFHATVVAPFRLADGVTEDELLRSFGSFCAVRQRFIANGLSVSSIGAFLALTPCQVEQELSSLAADAVDHFGPMRAPLLEDEIARRDPSRLTQRQAGYLVRYGYPYVHDEYRFHMTLTGALSSDVLAHVRPILERVFDPIASAPIAIDGLAVFVEPHPGAPFIVRKSELFDSPQSQEDQINAA